ncbi:MAG: hypothetical protein IKR21_05730 [Oscillospiraceae bacterium]|nr:hypothetical protein [Oscillospiraceae bacterium]
MPLAMIGSVITVIIILICANRKDSSDPMRRDFSDNQDNPRAALFNEAARG